MKILRTLFTLIVAFSLSTVALSTLIMEETGSPTVKDLLLTHTIPEDIRYTHLGKTYILKEGSTIASTGVTDNVWKNIQVVTNEGEKILLSKYLYQNLALKNIAGPVDIIEAVETSKDGKTIVTNIDQKIKGSRQIVVVGFDEESQLAQFYFINKFNQSVSLDDRESEHSTKNRYYISIDNLTMGKIKYAVIPIPDNGTCEEIAYFSQEELFKSIGLGKGFFDMNWAGPDQEEFPVFTDTILKTDYDNWASIDTYRMEYLKNLMDRCNKILDSPDTPKNRRSALLKTKLYQEFSLEERSFLALIMAAYTEDRANGHVGMMSIMNVVQNRYLDTLIKAEKEFKRYKEEVTKAKDAYSLAMKGCSSIATTCKNSAENDLVSAIKTALDDHLDLAKRYEDVELLDVVLQDRQYSAFNEDSWLGFFATKKKTGEEANASEDVYKNLIKAHKEFKIATYSPQTLKDSTHFLKVTSLNSRREQITDFETTYNLKTAVKGKELIEVYIKRKEDGLMHLPENVRNGYLAKIGHWSIIHYPERIFSPKIDGVSFVKKGGHTFYPPLPWPSRSNDDNKWTGIEDREGMTKKITEEIIDEVYADSFSDSNEGEYGN